MEKPLILIVEDDPAQNRIFTIAMKSDFTVETFADGNAAAARLDQVIPALVLLDLNLPGKSGRELLAKIRADARTAQTRVILATADEQQANVLFEDADLVLLKPISPAQLKQFAQRLTQETSQTDAGGATGTPIKAQPHE